MSPSETPEKPPRDQQETDADEASAIQVWERHHPRPPRANTLLHEGDIYTAWLSCAHCGHRQAEKIQKGQVMRGMVCKACHKVGYSKVPE